MLTFAAILGFIFFVPVVFTIVTSVKLLNQVFEFPIRWIPETVQWQNYWIPLVEKDFSLFFLNSIIVAVSVTFGSVFFGSMGGYSLAKFHYPARAVFFALVLIVMMVPIEVVIVPLAIIVRRFGMINTRWGLIMPVLISPLSVFWMRQYIVTIPNDYCDAARVDGYGEFRLFLRIILPMCTPALGALAIFMFMTNWNSLIWPMVVTSSKAVRTVPVAIMHFQGEFQVVWHELFAMSVLSVLPLLIVFFAARQQLLRGMAMGGLKG